MPKSHVLTLRWIMRPAEAGRPDGRAGVPRPSVIRNCLESAASTDKPIRVIEDGQLLGVVDRARILAAVADTIGERLIGTMAGRSGAGGGAGRPAPGAATG